MIRTIKRVGPKGAAVGHFAGVDSATPGICAVADVYDQDDLFDLLDDEAVLQLSRLGGSDGFPGLPSIRKSTGIQQRRILKHGVTAATLAVRLCEQLEVTAHLDLRDCDSILLCHSHTDHEECRRLAREIEPMLGLPLGAVSPFNHGCTGFLKLLQDASLEIESLPPGARVALLSVETPEFWHDASDRLFCGLVSAGAIGAVVEYGGRLPLDRVAADDVFIPASQRPNPNPLFRTDETDVFCFRGNPCRRTVMRMNPEPVFINAIELMLSNLRAALDSFDRQDGERVVVIPHQPSAKLLKALVATGQSEFPDVEFLNNLAGYGNVISASVPTVLSRLDEVLEKNGRGPMSDGDHLILVAAGICMDDISDKMAAGFAHIRWAPVAAPVPHELAAVPRV
jgi:3-oxoacyl-[acyl-carrier-protein] synthase-3